MTSFFYLAFFLTNDLCYFEMKIMFKNSHLQKGKKIGNSQLSGLKGYACLVSFTYVSVFKIHFNRDVSSKTKS